MKRSAPLVIVGAGPAGLAAAKTALDHGLPAVLLDEQPAAGGQIYRGVGEAGEGRRKVLGADYAKGADLLRVLADKGLDYRPGAEVWEMTREREIFFTRQGAVERLAADQLILCTGAIERPMPFPGWTLPGVMTCGAAQILLKTAGVYPKQDIVLAGSGPLLLLLATQLLATGAKIAALVETTPSENYKAAFPYLPAALQAPDYLIKGLGFIRDLKRAGVPWHKSARELEALGDRAVSGLRFRDAVGVSEVACGALLLHQGVVPNVQISRSLRLEHLWDPLQRCWRPKLDDWGLSEIPGVAVAGDGGGIVGAKASEAQGGLAALDALRRLGELDTAARDAKARFLQKDFRREVAPRRFLDALYRPSDAFLRPSDETIACRCEEVTAGRIREFVALGCLGPNQAKAFGRSGMGPCQGRVCGLLVSEIMADARGVSPDEVGYYRIRPPIKPVTLGEMASMAED
jgi:NADPH-dependent 2,4-dienoyl-CoA reductase/sulfur reductase-like enzyme